MKDCRYLQKRATRSRGRCPRGPFSEVRPALEDARSRGWKLAILSNTDRDFIDASMERIGVPFELAIVASEIGSYKPGHAALERILGAHDAAQAGRARGGEPLPRRLAGSSSACRWSGSTGSAKSPSRSRRASCTASQRSPRRSTKLVPLPAWSRLRARCPDCRTLTAVALGAEYQCHSCGREFAAAIVRVAGHETAALPYPEAAVVTEDEQELERVLPQRPIVLGGDAAFHERVASVVRGTYLVVTDPAARPPAPEHLGGVGVIAAAATPENAGPIGDLLAALGL